MDKQLTLFQRLARNVRWYFEDIVTSVTGKGTLHFVYGEHQSSVNEAHRLDVNPASQAPMLSATRDVLGFYRGTARRD